MRLKGYRTGNGVSFSFATIPLFSEFFFTSNKKFTSLLVCWVRTKCLNIPGMVRIGLEFERRVGREFECLINFGEILILKQEIF